MKRKNELVDITPKEQRHFEGDLAYGRYRGNNPSRGDFPADRNTEGLAVNKPICKLVLQQPRNLALWGGLGSSKRKVVKNIVNDSTFQNTVLKILAGKLTSLRFNLTSFKMNKDRWVIQ